MSCISFEVILLMIILFLLAVAIARKLLYFGIIVIILGFAYYSGMATVAIDTLASFVSPYLPEGVELVNFLPIPFFLK